MKLPGFSAGRIGAASSPGDLLANDRGTSEPLRRLSVTCSRLFADSELTQTDLGGHCGW